MRIKNWLLLLARMALVALMALALARPSLYSQVPLGTESQPTALGLVFDTSLSMGYIEKDKTRLDEAKERAREIVSKLPDSSLVFVVDSAEPPVPVGRSPSAALEADRRADDPADQPAAQFRDGPGLSRGRRMRPAAARRLRADRPLPDVVESRSGRPRASTRSRSSRRARARGSSRSSWAWPPRRSSNVSLEQAEPSSSVATQGEPIEIRGRIRSQGTKPMTRVVEF